MITDEEKKEIIGEAVEKAVEKALLLLPEVVGSLMANHAALAKLNSQFYKDNPEFKDRKDVVTSVVEMIEGKNPLKKYEDILTEAVPEIRQRLLTIKGMDTAKVEKPVLDFNGKI
jgi:predicted RNA-binding protein with EMAP domain